MKKLYFENVNLAKTDILKNEFLDKIWIFAPVCKVRKAKNQEKKRKLHLVKEHFGILNLVNFSGNPLFKTICLKRE